MATLLSRPPERLHHHAYVVKDQEANRRFFEDVLGMHGLEIVESVQTVVMTGASDEDQCAIKLGLVREVTRKCHHRGKT